MQRCKVVASWNVGSFTEDDTMQRSAKALPLFVFLPRQFLQPQLEHKGRIFFLCRDCRRTQRGKKNGPFNRLRDNNWAKKRKMNSQESTKIVGSVLYAMVVSALVSAASTCTSDVDKIVGLFSETITFQTLENFLTHRKVLMGIGILIFLTQYFCDEWQYSDCKDYPKEKPSTICWGWLFFLGQICLLPYSLRFSAALGIIALAIVTWGMFRNAKNDTEHPAAIKRFALENILWGIILLINWFVTGQTYFSILFLFPILIPVFRHWVKWGLPQQECKSEGTNTTTIQN